MNQSFFLRQLDIADPTRFKDKTVTVIGAGGIGAATVAALAKTGFENITVYDLDTVGGAQPAQSVTPDVGGRSGHTVLEENHRPVSPGSRPGRHCDHAGQRAVHRSASG